MDVAASPRDTWLEDPAILNEASRKRVRETIGRITREQKTLTRGRVVAGLLFGFWRALFDKKNSRLWVSHLHRAFPAGTGDRAEVAMLMSSLVPFRNRLAHHETIMGRHRIESIFQTLKDLLTLERHSARTLHGPSERVLQRFPALTAAIALNHSLGRPTRSLIPNTA